MLFAGSFRQEIGMRTGINSARRALVAASAAALCGVLVTPAQAALEWRLTGPGNVVIFTVIDGDANDVNPTANVIEVNAAAANAALSASGSEYRLTSAGANSNCGNPAGC